MSRKIFKKFLLYVFFDQESVTDSPKKSGKPKITTIYSRFYVSNPQHIGLYKNKTFNVKNNPQLPRK